MSNYSILSKSKMEELDQVLLSSCMETKTETNEEVKTVHKPIETKPVIVAAAETVEAKPVTNINKYIADLKASVKQNKNGTVTLNQRSAGKAILTQYKFINNERFFYKYNDSIGVWEKTSKTELNSIITNDLDKHCNYWSDSAVRGTANYVFNTTYGNITGDTFDKVFNKDIYSIVFNNGTLNLRTGLFENTFNVYDYNTVRIPHNYNAAAATPLNTIKFLSMITDKQDELDFIFQWIGYLMVKGYPIQKMLFLNGDGGNGKSTLIKLLTAVVGDDNTSAVSISSLINNRFQSALLYNKLFNTVADINSDFFDDSSILKALTGDDTITVERKGENGFVYKNFAKMTYSCNRLPKFKDTSGGLERRILVLDLNQDFTTLVKASGMHINDILNDTEEMEKVVSYSVKKFMEVMQNNFTFTESETMLKAKLDWLNDDPLVDFMKECFEFTNNKANSIPMKDFMAIYKTYCADRNYKAMSQKNVIEAIKTNGELIEKGVKVARESKKTSTYKITGVSAVKEEWLEELNLL